MVANVRRVLALTALGFATLMAPVNVGFVLADAALTTQDLPFGLCGRRLGFELPNPLCDPCPCEDPVWSVLSSAGGLDYPVGLFVTPDGQGVVMAGATQTGCDSGFGGCDRVLYDFSATRYTEGSTVSWSSAFGQASQGERPVASVLSGDGNRLFVMGDVGDDATATWAVDAATGGTLWQANDSSGSGSGLALVGGVLIVDTGATVVARSATDGAMIWSKTMQATGLAGRDGRAFLSRCDTIAVDAATGTTLWSAALGSNVLVGEGASSVYAVGCSGGLRARDGSDGRLLWQRSDLAGSLALHPEGHTLYALTANPFGDKTLWAVDAVDGETLWQAPADAGGLGISHEGRFVFVTGHAATLERHVLATAHDAETGAAEWRATAPRSGLRDEIQVGRITTSPSGERLYVAGTLYSDADGSAEPIITLAYDIPE